MIGHQSALPWPEAPPRDTSHELVLSRAPDDASPFEPVTIVEAAWLAARVAGVITVTVLLVALVVRAGLASEVRRWLAFPFTGIPARPAEAATIFLHNLRALAAVGGLLLVAQSGYAGQTGQPGVVHRAVRAVGEALLGAAVAANVIVVGASLGAYGLRMVGAALPHGPVELAAYALTLALYLKGRRRPLAIRPVLGVTAFSVLVLALAAVLETYVNV